MVYKAWFGETKMPFYDAGWELRKKQFAGRDGYTRGEEKVNAK